MLGNHADRICISISKGWTEKKKIYFALGIIALSFPVIIVSNRTYVAPLSGIGVPSYKDRDLEIAGSLWELYRVRYSLT